MIGSYSIVDRLFFFSSKTIYPRRREDLSMDKSAIFFYNCYPTLLGSWQHNGLILYLFYIVLI
jgi:hypothetical protein